MNPARNVRNRGVKIFVESKPVACNATLSQCSSFRDKVPRVIAHPQYFTDPVGVFRDNISRDELRRQKWPLTAATCNRREIKTRIQSKIQFYRDNLYFVPSSFPRDYSPISSSAACIIAAQMHNSFSISSSISNSQPFECPFARSYKYTFTRHVGGSRFEMAISSTITF